MKSYFCLTAIVLLSVVSCKRVTTDNISTLALNDKIKDTAEALIPERIDFDFPLSALGIYVWNDSIAVVRNSHMDRKHKFLELYNLRSGEFLKSFVDMGNGPGEMLVAKFFYQNDTVLMQDVMKRHITVIPLDSALSGSFKPEFKDTDIRSQVIWPYHSGLLALNPYCFVNEDAGVYNNGARFIISDSNYVYKETKEYEFDTYNSVLASFFISYPNGRIAVYNSIEPEIELYDTDLRLIKKIRGPELTSNIRYNIMSDGDVLTIGAPTSYYCECYDDNYFYLTFVGRFIEDDETIFDIDRSYIFKFDWDGNFVDSYYVDHFVSSMSLSEDGQSMYIFGVNRDGENVFYRARLT